MPLASLCFLLCLFFCPTLAWSQCPAMTTQQTAFAQEQLTISDVAKPLTPAVYKPSGVTPSMAVVSVEGGTIRYLEIGTPTPLVGHPVGGGTTFQICGFDSIAAFKAIRIVSDALLSITYYKPK
jgi:hypothetical protein